MLSIRRFVPATATVALALSTLSAQALQLDVHGCSLPGTIELDVYPAAYPLELMIVLPSATSGPTPCAIFDQRVPKDRRCSKPTPTRT